MLPEIVRYEPWNFPNKIQQPNKMSRQPQVQISEAAHQGLSSLQGGVVAQILVATKLLAWMNHLKRIELVKQWLILYET